MNNKSTEISVILQLQFVGGRALSVSAGGPGGFLIVAVEWMVASVDNEVSIALDHSVVVSILGPQNVRIVELLFVLQSVLSQVVSVLLLVMRLHLSLHLHLHLSLLGEIILREGVRVRIASLVGVGSPDSLLELKINKLLSLRHTHTYLCIIFLGRGILELNQDIKLGMSQNNQILYIYSPCRRHRIAPGFHPVAWSGCREICPFQMRCWPRCTVHCCRGLFFVFVYNFEIE